MPLFPPINPSLHVLELASSESKRIHRVLVRIERKEGERPSIHLKVYAQPLSRPGRWEFIGDFGGRLERVDSTGPLYNITAGGMHLRDLRGLHIGTWCQNQVMLWLHEQPPGRTKSFPLAAGDALDANRDRRNRFYEQFGSRFEWDVPGVSGICPEQPTSDFRALEEVRGVLAMDVVQALALAHSRLGHLECEVEGSRAQLGNLSTELDRVVVREALWRWACIGAVAVGLLALWFLRG